MSKNSVRQFTSIGGQAVIEGVMMRSPHFVAVAVRKPNQRILIRYLPYVGFSQRFPFLKKPILRGITALIESMVQGVEALSYSAEVASEAENSGEKLSRWAIASSIFTAFTLGMGLFVALPHFVTAVLTGSTGWSGVSWLKVSPESPVFHLIDGILRMTVLLLYVHLIALMKDIHRVFQYHGAEHKSIYAFEAGEELTVENARKYTTLHPRCGTSFLLFLVLISVVIFSGVMPLVHLNPIHPLLNHLRLIGLKILLMLPIAGLAYELIKVCAFRMENPFFKILIWPGMILQKLTTREPTDDQLEVALASLRKVLVLEKSESFKNEISQVDRKEVEIDDLADLGEVRVLVAEFPEV